MRRLLPLLLALLAAAPAAGQTPTMQLRPAPADSFVGIFSVQTHLLSTGGVYGTGWETIIRPRLLELGVRHIRERMNGASATVVGRWRDLAANGITLTAGCWPQGTNYSDARHCVTTANQIGPAAIDAFDGWNEVDGGKVGAAWPAAWVAWQTTLYRTLKGDSQWHNRPVLGSSLAHANSADQLGNQAGILDKGNPHSYPGGGGLPGNYTANWKPEWNQVDGGKPDFVTETGYHSCPSCTNGIGVSERAQGKYIGRLYAEYFVAGAERVNWYELIDEGVSSTDREKNWGLLRNTGAPKPAYTTVKNLLALLRDPGPAFAPAVFSYRLTASSSVIHRLILAKRDGRVYVLLWQEVYSWNTQSKSDIAVAPRSATVTLPARRTFRLYRPGQGTGAVSSQRGLSFTVPVPDEVVVLEVSP
jgi:hypothetical protein